MKDLVKFLSNGQWQMMSKTDRADKQKKLAAYPNAQGHRPKAEGEETAETLRQKMSTPDKADVDNHSNVRPKDQKVDEKLTADDIKNIKAERAARKEGLSNAGMKPNESRIKTPEQIAARLKFKKSCSSFQDPLIKTLPNGQWFLLGKNSLN